VCRDVYSTFLPLVSVKDSDVATQAPEHRRNGGDAEEQTFTQLVADTPKETEVSVRARMCDTLRTLFHCSVTRPIYFARAPAKGVQAGRWTPYNFDTAFLTP